MNILIMSNLYPPIVSGSSTQASMLAKELINHGHTVIVITTKSGDDQKSYELENNIHIYRIPSINLPKMAITFNFPWIQWTLTPGNLNLIESIIKKHKPDIIHLHNHMFDLAISAVIMKHKFKIPLVITIHTIVQHPNKFYNIILQLIDKSILKYCVIDQADWIINPDKTCSQYIQQTFDKKNSVIILYGIEEAIVTDTSISKTIIDTYHLEGKQIFLSLGHVHELRNRKDIIDAMPEILKTFPDFILLIVGDIGTKKPQLLAQKLGVENSVIFTGSVPHSVVPSLFEISDMVGQWFHISNPQNKTLGIATLEAMSAGKIIIGTADEDVYGDGILINKKNVILIPPQHPEILAKYVIEILQHKYDHIGTNASKTIKQYFLWPAVCDQTIHLYERALSEKHT